MGAYAARLHYHETYGQSFDNSGVVPHAMVRPEVQNVNELGEAIRASLNGRAVTPLVDDAAIVAQISPTVTRVPGERYRSAKIGRERIVTYAGVPVAYCTTKRTQRRTVRALNKTLG